MKTITPIFFLSLLPRLQACSSNLGYETLRNHQKAQCLKLPEAQYDSCMEELGESYGEYKQQRDRALDTDRD